MDGVDKVASPVCLHTLAGPRMGYRIYKLNFTRNPRGHSAGAQASQALWWSVVRAACIAIPIYVVVLSVNCTSYYTLHSAVLHVHNVLNVAYTTQSGSRITLYTCCSHFTVTL